MFLHYYILEILLKFTFIFVIYVTERTPNTEQCTAYGVHYIQCISYTLYAVRYVRCAVQCTVYSVQCTVYTIQCTMYSNVLHCMLYMYT